MDSETLLREMFNPQHVSDGKIVVTAVSLTELRSSGFSVHRKEYVSLDVVQKSMEERLGRPRKGQPWKDEGVAEIVTREVRKLKEDGRPLFVVIDTALSDNRGHASIYAASPTLGDAHARKLRMLLTPLLENRRPLRQVFEEDDCDGGHVNDYSARVRNRVARVFRATGLGRMWRYFVCAARHSWRTDAQDRDREPGDC